MNNYEWKQIMHQNLPTCNQFALPIVRAKNILRHWSQDEEEQQQQQQRAQLAAAVFRRQPSTASKKI